MAWAKFIPWLPALAAILCALCATQKRWRKLAAPICILGIFGSFCLTLLTWGSVPALDFTQPLDQLAKAHTVTAFEWIRADNFRADFSYLVDPLTLIMLGVVTGIGTLVAIYASGYMDGDKGYARFFGAVSLFIFAMTSLVLADNLVLLYLGWEGVGLCSYLLIGYYYDKPSAVAAAKKAFIVNRIGDLGFALGIFLTYKSYGSVNLLEILHTASENVHAAGKTYELSTSDHLIPFLLMLGAFGKSAQLPLYVWLPDAMEGPTPVSALIHAATMVTAGVYMIARLTPLFLLSPQALPTVAVVGGLTALFAATIGLCQYDIKRIYAYSTISQLGYMFLGLGVASTFGAVFHLYTHAFFKALLFLTAGSVMHGLSGQLDLRKMSGLRHKMPVTAWLMFVGCLALAGVFPFAGFFSKDEIISAVMTKAYAEHNGHVEVHAGYMLLTLLALFTAFLTAFYTFRLWFRVFLGPVHYELGDEHHGSDEGHDHANSHAADTHHHDHDHSHGHDHDHAHAHAAAPAPSGVVVHHEHDHEPHEMPWLMNAPLVVLAAGAVLTGLLTKHSIETLVGTSSAAMHSGEHGHGPLILGMSIHSFVATVSSILAVLGILLAYYFHAFDRTAADRVAQRHAGLVSLLAHKYYVDEILDQAVVKPLRLAGEVFFIIDRLIIDGIVWLVGQVPGVLAIAGWLLTGTRENLPVEEDPRSESRAQLQGYGLGMAAGIVALLLIVIALW